MKNRGKERCKNVTHCVFEKKDIRLPDIRQSATLCRCIYMYI